MKTWGRASPREEADGNADRWQRTWNTLWDWAGQTILGFVACASEILSQEQWEDIEWFGAAGETWSDLCTKKRALASVERTNSRYTWGFQFKGRVIWTGGNGEDSDSGELRACPRKFLDLEWTALAEGLVIEEWERKNARLTPATCSWKAGQAARPVSGWSELKGAVPVVSPWRPVSWWSADRNVGLQMCSLHFGDRKYQRPTWPCPLLQFS